MHNKTAILALFLQALLIADLNAQPPAGPANIDPETYFEQGLSGWINMPSQRILGNQHYPGEEWHHGEVTLVNGIVIKNKRLRYNAFMDELFWLWEGEYQQVQLDKNLIREFRIFPGLQNRPVIFRRIEIYSPVMIGKDNIFAEVLYDGDVSLYAYRRVIETGRGDKLVGDKLHGGYTIRPSHMYIIMLPDNTSRITRRIRRRNILDLFPEERGEIRSLLRQHRIRPSNEPELIETARILDISLFRE